MNVSTHLQHPAQRLLGGGLILVLVIMEGHQLLAQSVLTVVLDGEDFI